MRSAQKRTPASEKKNGKESASGKKLVQARLPFKILSGTSSPTALDGGATAEKLEVVSKKRKLSYTEADSENPKKIGKSDSKENLTLDKVDTAAAVPIEDVIILDDEEAQDAHPILSPNTSTISTKNRKSNKSTPRTAGTSTSKVQIKLPLSSKKKKRKSKGPSQSAKCEVSDSSDVELVSEEHQPHKKVKHDDSIRQRDGSEEKSMINKDSPEATVDLNKNKQDSPNKKESRIPDIISSIKPQFFSKTDGDTPNKHEVDKDDNIKEIEHTVSQIVNAAKYSPTKEKSTNKEELKCTKSTEKESKEEETIKLRTSQEKRRSKTLATEKSSKKENVTNGNKVKKANLKILGSAKISKIDKNTKKKVDIGDTKADNTADSKGNLVETTTPIKKTISPRRSIRKSEIDQKKEENNKSLENLSSEPEFVSEKSSAADTSINESRKKLLTPKQLKQMEDRKKVREEKERRIQQVKEERDRKLQEQREERERKLQEEKVQKQKEREERELLRKKEREEKDDQKRREKEEKEEQRRKEKEDKERKRLAEVEAKNEEKRKKDEAKEEERRKKEEDRRRKELEKEEEENKKKKAAQAFTKFFVTKTSKPQGEDDQESRDDAESIDSLAFRPFQVKGDMKLAPLVRREFKERSRKELDSFLKENSGSKAHLYIGELKKGNHIPLRGSKTVLKDSDDDDVILLENELETAAQAIDEARPKQIQKYKAKFFFFRENRRPPFYGTWRKKSTVITPRKPFATDEKFFDYEVDSDDEWEEEEPGESLNGSEDEKDESEDEDYEVDNEWFVPHGHLSDEEMQNEDELGPDTSREAQKAKLKALQQEFAQEMKKKTEKIKPRLIGAIWEDENGNRPNLCPTVIWDSLCTRAMMICEPLLIEEPETNESEPNTPPPEKQKRLEINDELMSDLVRLVHGNRHSRVFLIKEFMAHVSNTCDTIKNGECLVPTKALIREKIDEISEWSIIEASSTKKKNKKKLCWVVSADVLDKYSLGKLGLRNEWSYKLQPKFDIDKSDPSVGNETNESVKSEKSDTIKTSENEKKKTTISGITKFAKVLTKEEKQNKVSETTSAVDTSPRASVKNSPKIAITKAAPKTKPAQKSTKPVTEKSQPEPSSPLIKTPIVKKRVALLMSVPPGQQFSPQSKNALISNFLQKNKTTLTLPGDGKSATSVSLTTHMDVDDVVVLD